MLFRSDAKKGDVIMFSNSKSTAGICHTGIYAGHGRVIHASTPATGVCIRADKIPPESSSGLQTSLKKQKRKKVLFKQDGFSIKQKLLYTLIRCIAVFCFFEIYQF